MGFSTMGKKHYNYQTCTIEEYFKILESKNKNKIVAKSLIKYLKNKELVA